MKNLLYKLYVFILVTVLSSELFASSSKLKSWANNTVRSGQSIGLSWMTGALVICGFLSLLGMQYAQGMIARILMGSGLIFGAGAIGSLLKNIFA